MPVPPPELVALTRRLGDPTLDLAILAEGNTSTKADEPGTFWVKASGQSMGVIEAGGFVLVQGEALIKAIDSDLSDEEVKKALQGSRVDPEEKAMPSVETFMHAYFLSLPGVNWVGHTHPGALLPIICRPDARQIATWRLFPDEVVCCGPATCFVPYCDPGLPLARGIRERVMAYVETFGDTPKTIWMANHGLIALGKTQQEVITATLMSAKAARAWNQVLPTTDFIRLSASQIDRIHNRPDEHYRQKLLAEMTR